MTGTIIGHYKILAKLGEGGMGVVYKAEDTSLKRVVALKFLPAAFLESKSRRRRFIQEAYAASALDHPNICTIYEIHEEEDGQLFIAMAYYEGETVKDLIRRGPVPVDLAVEIAVQTAQGLAKAHQKEITHRDIKPANLIRTQDGIVKILDFGLALRKDDPKLTKSGEMVGTVAYMSPEQIYGEAIDHHSDIWALGIVMYEMLTGVPPFQKAYVNAILHETPRRVTALRPEVPAEIEAVVHKAIEKRLENRYQQVTDLLGDLQRWNENRSTQAAGITRTMITAAARPPAAIAVLPFENVSPDKDNEYFSDGLTEELISALANVPGLRVVSRSSVFALKGKIGDVRTVGALLRAKWILEGSVRRMGDRVRIMVQLTSADEGYQIWSERYDGEMKDVFAVQDEITRSIVSKIRSRFTSGDSEVLLRRYTGDIEAYHLYLKGRYYWNQMTGEALQKARQYFEQALVRDPKYSIAYAGVADYYLTLGFWSIASPAEAWPKAREAALKALEIDASLAEAHSSLGYVRLFFDWDFRTALQEFQRAIEIQPSCSQARQGYALYLMQAGRTTESIAASVEARNCDPLSPFLNTMVAWSFYYARRYDEAIGQCRKVLEMTANYFEAYIVLGLAYEQKLQSEAAVEAFEKARALSQENPLVLGVLGACYARAGRTSEALSILAQLTASSKERYVAPISLAMLHAGFGDMEAVFESLDRAFAVRDGLLGYLRVFPIYDPFRDDPRFVALIKKIGLPEGGEHAG
jgi:serine/threonine protein kinase/Flp pilus assembly protein TadD